MGNVKCGRERIRVGRDEGPRGGEVEKVKGCEVGKGRGRESI